MTISLVQVAVGMPTNIGRNRQGDVLSGIAKQTLEQESVEVQLHNIVGDGQADTRAHGGPDKAIYCCPREHRAFWAGEIGYVRDDAPFGENLSVTGILEDEARIGDIWQWGEARLQISQPRWPCYKLAMHTGHPDMVKRFAESERSGWYLRILQEGSAPTTGHIDVVQRDPLGISVRMAVQAKRGTLDREQHSAVMAHPALADAW